MIDSTEKLKLSPRYRHNKPNQPHASMHVCFVWQYFLGFLFYFNSKYVRGKWNFVHRM